MHCALRFGFKAFNNEAEYEALIAGLKLAKEMKVESLEIFRDSQLTVCQITDEYQAQEEKIAAYLQKAKGLLRSFSLVDHPQTNGQVEAVNKIIKFNLKTKLEEHKRLWAEELLKVLWAYRTIS